jgi:chemotaxis regulatin CheY-phosphate phosphatase CheZ
VQDKPKATKANVSSELLRKLTLCIQRTRDEISALRRGGSEEENGGVSAAIDDLAQVVAASEQAALGIIDAAERIQQSVGALRGRGDDAACDAIDGQAMEILMACSFQDITGQRTSRVVKLLREIEYRLAVLSHTWELADRDSVIPPAPVSDRRPDAALLKGPGAKGSLEQAGIDQIINDRAPRRGGAKG